MKIINKQYILEKPEKITVDYIERYIAKSGYSPLRWAIVQVNKEHLIIDSVII